MTPGQLHFRPPRRVIHLCQTLAVLGGMALLVELWQIPQRALLDLLLVSYYLLGLGLGGLVFVALLYVTGAGWAVALRRVPEAMAAVLPLAALGLAVVLLGRPSLYPWAGSVAAQAEPPTPLRQAWFNHAFFLTRAVVYLSTWWILGIALVSTSRRQDKDGALFHTRYNIRLSAALLAVFAITFWLATYDWVMSLDPGWYSTVFAVYQFAGLLLSALAAMVLLAAWLRRLGPFRQVLREAHVHDLGKLLFGFSTFWMYLWFCQYMLIWYVNNPEETAYFARRLHGGWAPLLLLNLVLNWGVPFLVLLPRATKRRIGILATVAFVVLVGRWLDLYLAILPAAGEPAWSPWEVGLAADAAGLFVLVFFAAFGRAAPIPVADPLLSESLPAHSQRPESSAR